MNPYFDYSTFLSTHFNEKVQKISINAGFTCPNRDGSIGIGGCTYCNNRTFSPNYTFNQHSVTQQIEEGVAFFSRKYPSMSYLAYFQSYTNTYGETKQLLNLYQEALAADKVVGIIISTRPDMLPIKLLDALAELAQKHFVMLELGIESTCNTTLRQINRGHTYQQAVEGIEQAVKRGIRVGGHLILGLPGEDRATLLNHATELSKLPLSTLKLHQLQIIRNTPMHRQWECSGKEFRLFTVDEYVNLCVEFLSKLRPTICVERFVSQSPQELLVAPNWGLKNHEFTALLVKELKRLNRWQGCQFDSHE